jgi:hypothetical protein
MNCANHAEVSALAYCRTCGKPLCASCTRDVRGVIYCENCLAARLEGTLPPAAAVAPAAPVAGIGRAAAPYSGGGGPNPAVAGILAGFFPFGVGAVYTSQYAKGLAHLVIFTLLVWGASAAHSDALETLLGLGIAFFYFYQIIDAVRSAKAVQAGQAPPDPFGLAQGFGAGEKIDTSRVPTGAVVLIGLGILFLLHTMGILEFGFERYWPLILIFLGGWLFARRWGVLGQPAGTCCCQRCRTRYVTGPVVLLTVGVLALLSQLNVAHLDRTWPLILLVIGAIKLIQNTASWEGHVAGLPPAPGATPPSGSADGGAQSPPTEVKNV